ncbi:MAG: hypothetical protein K8S16_19475 [Bacteroidales bacterium]|nr:hypothetical protein [Bacteroidales bacterium]
MYSKKVISTILFSFAICAVIGILFSKPDNDILLKQMFARKVHLQKKYDIIVAGDSRIYRGVSTDIIGESLNRSAINLGFSSGGFSKPMYDLIEKKLSQQTGSIVILAITPFSLTHQSSYNGHIISVNNLKREEVLNYLYFSKLTNYFTPTDPLKLWYKIFQKTKYKNNYLQEVHVNEGWVKSDHIVRYPYYALKSYQNTFSNTKISEKSIKDLFNKVKEWSSKGIDVYGFVPPSSANMELLERTYSNFNDSVFAYDFINSGGRWINLSNAYSSYDGSHLDAQSAALLSKEISSSIKRGLYIDQDNPEKICRINYFQFESKFEYFNDYETDTANNVETKLAFSGNKVLKCKPEILYTGLFNNTTDFLHNKKINTVLGEFYVYFEIPDARAQIAIETIQEGVKTKIASLELSYSTLPKKWGKIMFEFQFPANLQKDDRLNVYIVNTDYTNILIDDCKLSFY